MSLLLSLPGVSTGQAAHLARHHSPLGREGRCGARPHEGPTPGAGQPQGALARLPWHPAQGQHYEDQRGHHGEPSAGRSLPPVALSFCPELWVELQPTPVLAGRELPFGAMNEGPSKSRQRRRRSLIYFRAFICSFQVCVPCRQMRLGVPRTVQRGVCTRDPALAGCGCGAPPVLCPVRA